MSYGWGNSLPLEIGGSSTEIEAIYDALRNAVGVGGAGPVDGIEDLWRQSKAIGLAAATTSMERAALQALPMFASDHLPVYEELLGIVPGADDTEADRVTAVSIAWSKTLRADGEGLGLAVQAIDARAGLDYLDNTTGQTVTFGKAFAPRPDDGSYGTTTTQTDIPNWSTDFFQLITYALDPGATIIATPILLALRRLLNEVLPSWVDWEINDGYGFYLDGGADGSSLLDYKALT